MTKELRQVILSAVQAGKNGVDPGPFLTQSVLGGSLNLTLEELDFDSLGWMEFCISIEMDTGLELTPLHVEKMRRLIEVEEWLRARLHPPD